jgi:RecA-family ATPase
MGLVDSHIARVEASVAKFDAGRLRKLAETMVREGDMQEPERLLLDLDGMNWGQLIEDYRSRVDNYCTAPFDPEGAKFRLYPGGVTIWSGYPGAGKTTLLRQLVCHLMRDGHGVFFASLEEDPQDVLVRLVQTAAGLLLPTREQGEAFGKTYGSKIRVWGVIGIAKHRKIIGAIQQLAAQGMTHAFIDSLMCLDINNDDYEGQRQFANLLAATARAQKIHIHLVAHPRKAISSTQEPDLNDVAGAREIAGIADNVVFIRRGSRDDDQGVRVPMRVAIKKQRHGTGMLCEIEGDFHRDYRQFHIGERVGPIRYLPEEAYA